ncbi:recombinase RecF [Paucibacter sp. KBW04]|uniref:AAA family ATPase n=1 Tax=Paucibacter sp. KBW04 TaxID=2153361 RepID=UPI000F5782E2|nr:AAA family ATPase [Paucibacter sp. KBW04]RQO58001.1 recombinase RecF [Paucibacter sp. KBW04]
MELISIDVQNVLGVRAAALAISTPVTLIAGPNGNGKSSLAEAVRMALGGDVAARGVALKKDLQALVNEGAKSGSVEVQLADGLTAYAMLPSGKTTPADVYVPHRALAYVLEPSRFASLTANDRRSMLFDLMGLRVTPELVIQRLEAKGVDKTKAVRVGPLLRAGFDAAHDEAKRKATEAKGAWRALTGETYGAVKAETWAASVPAHDEATAKTLATELQHCEVALEQWQRQIGQLQGAEQRLAQARAKLPALQDQAGKLQRIQDKLVADESGLAEWEQRLQATTAEAGQGKRVGLVHDLARAVEFLSSNYGGELYEHAEALPAYEREHGKLGAAGNPEAQAKLPEVRKSRDLMVSAVANGKRDVEAAKRAQAEAEAIQAELDETFDAAGLADARAKADELKAERATLVKKLDGFKALKAQAEAAQKKTTDAAAHHVDVAAWDQIAAALAPDGIPGEMLAEALGPFNARLDQSAADTSWPGVHIGADMTVTWLDGRPYKLLSESEKWRADAMLAEAISHLAGLKLLLLDRFDVLDLKGRGDLLCWLDVLAEQHEIDTALVLGTLKALPASSEFLTAHWIENGVLGQLKAAA